jgi:transketolase
MRGRFEASNWNVIEIDGHNHSDIDGAINKAKSSDKPTLIAAKTIIGFGSPNKKGTAGIHGSPLGDDEITLTRKELEWPHAPFVIPENIRNSWASIGKNSEANYSTWKDALDKISAADKSKWDSYFNTDIEAVKKAIVGYKEGLASTKKAYATRQSSQLVLHELAELMPSLIGGSADLTGSNNTKANSQNSITPTDFSGSYVHYGIREHAMAAVMNGMAVSGAFVPYGGTFLIFSDYCRNSMRLSALMDIRVIYVMTHDSIGLGEDGPTHQPIEQVASLRLIPGLNVYRPADAIETADSWMNAIESKGPSVVVLTRQALPSVAHNQDMKNNTVSKGAYVLDGDCSKRSVTIMASGSEVAIAMEAKEMLSSQSIEAVVVSAPCLDLFEAQSESYKNSVLGNAPIIAVEAGSPESWHRYTKDSNIIAMRSFGASAPAGELFKKFGITAEAIVKKAKEII